MFELHLAGATIRIFLLLTVGEGRMAYERMAEVLRVTRLRGKDLATNLAFHYGLVHWFLGQCQRPPDAIHLPYLTSVGELAQEAVGLM